MRITNPTLLRGYNRDLNRVMNLKNKSEHMITTTRRFSRASEDPLSAAKALNVRKSQYYSEQHQENLKVAAKFYTEAETSLIQVSEQMAIIRETIIAAVNTTKDYQDLDIYAQQLETKAEELCAIFNTDSAGRAIFGGESDNPQPFKIIKGSNGSQSIVTYHNIPVNSMRDFTKFPYSDDVNVDIGLGMVVNQESHYVDPDSVLKISFNGPEVSGCGAERGVADIDLSSIQEDRSYSLYVYAGDVKQEINFTGKATQADNVAEIRSKLKQAFRKEIAFGRDYPDIDDQGVISLRSKMGDAVENGIVSVINNPYPEKHTSQLKVDNDSNYTDKYRMRLSALPEGELFSVDVQLGNGEKKTISFEAGTDNLSDPNNPIFREDITVKNFQAALDEAFGKGKLTISAEDPTKGVVSAEGQAVKIFQDKRSMDEEEETVSVQSPIIGTATTPVESTNQLYIGGLNKGTSYVMNMTLNGIGGRNIQFTAGNTVYDTKKAIADAVENEFGGGTLDIDAEGKFTYTKEDGTVCTVTIKETNPDQIVTNFNVANNTVPLGSFEAGKTYAMNVTIGGNTKEIQFAGGNAETVKGEIAAKIKAKFPNEFKTGENGTPPDIVIDTTGKVTYTAGDIKLSNAESATLPKSIELGETKTYQIKLNELKEGQTYSLKFIAGNEIKNISFKAGATTGASKAAIQTALGNFATAKNNGMDANLLEFTAGDEPVTIVTNFVSDGSKNTVFERESAYSNNYIQLTLDAARALREGDIDYANGCIDRLVSSNEKLLVEIADMGCNEEFIDFNISRLTVRDENLAERQNDLEIIDPAKQITLWKQYEAMYNACLQMSSSVVPQSIFDYL